MCARAKNHLDGADVYQSRICCTITNALTLSNFQQAHKNGEVSHICTVTESLQDHDMNCPRFNLPHQTHLYSKMLTANGGLPQTPGGGLYGISGGGGGGGLCTNGYNNNNWTGARGGAANGYNNNNSYNGHQSSVMRTPYGRQNSLPKDDGFPMLSFQPFEHIAEPCDAPQGGPFGPPDGSSPGANGFLHRNSARKQYPPINRPAPVSTILPFPLSSNPINVPNFADHNYCYNNEDSSTEGNNH